MLKYFYFTFSVTDVSPLSNPNAKSRKMPVRRILFLEASTGVVVLVCCRCPRISCCSKRRLKSLASGAFPTSAAGLAVCLFPCAEMAAKEDQHLRPSYFISIRQCKPAKSSRGEPSTVIILKVPCMLTCLFVCSGSLVSKDGRSMILNV